MIDALFVHAEVLTEGGLDEAGRWFGSIMVTFDLDRLAEQFRGLETDDGREQLLDLASGSVRVRLLGHRLAMREVYRRFVEHPVGTAVIESRFRREGRLLLVDMDLEVPVRAASEVPA